MNGTGDKSTNYPVSHADTQPNIASSSSTQSGTFECPYCPRKFTRAFNLRGHIRTHTDERPFICGVCGRAFTRQHDRRTHEKLHNRDTKWVCGGSLDSGNKWGCGRRYDRKSNLSRHHRSKAGRGCIKPTSDGNAAGDTTDVEKISEMQIPDLIQPPPQRTNAERSAAIALTDIARTPNISEISGVPSSQSNDPQETARISIDNASTSVDFRHTAAVHKLVMWPSIKILLHPEDYDQDQMVRGDRRRNPIYTMDLGDNFSLANDSILSTSSLAHNGAGGGSKSSLDESHEVHSEALCTDSCVEIDQFGRFKLSEKTSRLYYHSYLDRMHKLHPFLDEHELEMEVEAFIEQYCFRKSMSTIETSRCQACIELTRGRLEDSSSAGQIVPLNIANVIILLIFAVGAICDSEFPTASPVMNQSVECHLPRFSSPVRQVTLADSTQAVNNFLCPAPLHCAQYGTTAFYHPLHTPPNKLFPFWTSTSEIGENGSERMTHTGRDECGSAMNQPVVPGLTLYRLAAATLGRLEGTYNLEYVHACLLAGLYAGQCADPFQSHVWISEAARAYQLLIQTSPCEETNDHTKELRNFAYWSCVQLESDLLAELDISVDGMSRFENWVSLPRRTYPMNGPDGLISQSTIMMMYYYSQIQLQKSRNRMHTNPYENKDQGQASRLPSVQKAQIVNLDLWRTMLPLPLQWEDTDEPAKDINAARMRASYYRTKFIIHLPLLYYTIHYGQPIGWDESGAQFSVDSLTDCTATSKTHSHPDHACMIHMLNAMDSDISNNSSRFSQNWTSPAFDFKELPQWVLLECRDCVDCAIQSLTAFDGIEDRLVVPNIFGIAHEQFGYMLVLSAIYTSSLFMLVSPYTFDRLFKRTIRFLLHNEKNSPILRADIRILREIYLKIFKYPLILIDV